MVLVVRMARPPHQRLQLIDGFRGPPPYRHRRIALPIRDQIVARGCESYADADVRAGHALVRIGGYPARRPLVVSHEMIGRMLRRHLLGLDPDEALAAVHPQDVIYSTDPRTRAIHHLR
jgi:broad specificity phosphatase PhoE